MVSFGIFVPCIFGIPAISLNIVSIKCGILRHWEIQGYRRAEIGNSNARYRYSIMSDIDCGAAACPFKDILLFISYKILPF